MNCSSVSCASHWNGVCGLGTKQDADAVMFIWREDERNSNAERTLTLAKNKEGQLNNWPLTFRGDVQRFIPVSTSAQAATRRQYEGRHKQIAFQDLPESGDLPF